MIVKELIQKLKEMPQDAEVFIAYIYSDNGNPVCSEDELDMVYMNGPAVLLSVDFIEQEKEIIYRAYKENKLTFK